MNEELFLLFSEINPESQSALNHAFKKSPKMILLIDFLKTTTPNFKTPKAINFVYKAEIKQVNYNKLINRFYKLRQQLIEWLYHYLKKTERYASKEEQSLNFIRYLVNKNQFKNALDKAIKLEKHCRKLNLFELLPGIINMMIYCRQCLFYGGEAALIEDENRLLEVISWNQTLQKMQYYHQRSYRAIEPDVYKEILTTVRKLIAPYKDQPRFALIYHYIAFSKGCMIQGRVKQSTNALVRHLNKMEGILEANPQMPIVFAQAHYAKLTQFKLLLLKAVFYFQRGQFNKSAQLLKQRDRIAIANPNLPFPISESEIRNTISMFIASKQYDAALKKWEQLIAFYKKHEQEDRLDFALVEKVNIFFFQYPKGRLKAHQELLAQLEAVDPNKPYIHLINVSKIWIKLILGKELTRHEIFQETELFKYYGLDAVLTYRLSKATSNNNKKDLQTIVKELYMLIDNKSNSLQVLYYKQFIEIANSYLR
ncbi:hypothetical protein [Aureispira anguillae]|uniref:Uncharacterized protein n=1 Tax=Aureispira anguillae TaxID=2864201 RepID=A0A916DVF9_9BACT|nr:hypothetical protein [Aureispira anguillae]BDS14316.1 hypothetical protein AsAng_0050950 [Aureispira anguillae]